MEVNCPNLTLSLEDICFPASGCINSKYKGKSVRFTMNANQETACAAKKVCTSAAEVLEPDVVLVVGPNNEKVHAVSFLLSRISPVFEAAFDGYTEGSKDAIKEFIVPPNFDTHSILNIVQYSYGSKIKVKYKFLLNMRASALYFGIERLYDGLNNTLLQTIMKEKYFCWIFHEALLLHDKEVVEACVEAFHKFLDHDQVLHSQTFLCLEYEPDLCVLLQNRNLRGDAQEVAERLVEWAYLKENPGEALEKVNFLISQKLTSSDFFTNQTEISGISLAPFSHVSHPSHC